MALATLFTFNKNGFETINKQISLAVNLSNVYWGYSLMMLLMRKTKIKALNQIENQLVRLNASLRQS